MTVTRSMRRKLDYLVRVTGRSEADIVAEAVQEGVAELYRRQLSEAYLRGDMEREKAVTELGSDTVDDLDYARDAIDADVAWGLKSA